MLGGAMTTAPTPSQDRHNTVQASALAADGIPMTALQAYRKAAQRELALDPKCGLSWPLLAGIGRVESDHGRFAGAVLHTDGVSTPHIIGIPLDGHGTARILDTDRGRLDGDRVYDRAVGSMQFIPSTWSGYRVDGNGDGVIDPFNIFDAAAASANYLCKAGGDLTTLAGQTRAVRAYNNSDAYIALVLQLEGAYARGVPGLTVPILPTGSPMPTRRSPVAPANPGPPLGLRSSGSQTPTRPAPRSTSPTAPAMPSPSATKSPPPATVSPGSSDTSCPTATTTPSTSPSTSSGGGATPVSIPPTDSTSPVAPSSSSPASTAASTGPAIFPTC
jgi:hypothetical protein